MELELDRRSLVLGAAGAVATATVGAALAGQPGAMAGEPAAQEERELTFEEVDALRQQIIDSKTDHVCADGRVIPAVYVKLRALINSLGVGIGSDDESDTCFDFFMRLFTEEQAQAALQMPRGVYFTAADMAVRTGGDEAEWLETLEDMASHNLLFRARRAGVAYFHLIPVLHGIYEYNWPDYSAEWLTDLSNMLLKDQDAYWNEVYGAGSPFYYVVPAAQEVTATGEIGLYDDVMAAIDRNETLAVAPCQCRWTRRVIDVIDDEYLETHPLDTCIITGEEAEYYVENGLARQIDQDEAREIITSAVHDYHLILEHCYTKHSEVICCCDPDTCGPLGDYMFLATLPEGTYEGINCYDNVSHYLLVHDKEACVKCGLCAERCPMHAVTMSEEDGYPEISRACVGCGQCALVCPVEARKLQRKETIEELPDDMLADINQKAEVRFRVGHIH